MTRQRLPEWLKKSGPYSPRVHEVKKLLTSLGLRTVCQGAKCPNRAECFSRGTATFMIMGGICTRDCRFCAVAPGTPHPTDENEPANLAEAVRLMGLKHAVITSVTRDDLPDGGAGHFAKVITAIRNLDQEIGIEVLTPDFQGDDKALEKVLRAGPDVLNHNVETVPRLYPEVRPLAVYRRSLDLLRKARGLYEGITTKSGIMVGLGEEEGEVVQVMEDLRGAGCDILTIGQYLQPTRDHLPVVSYITPEQFSLYETLALQKGFKAVASGPLVRSSYNAREVLGHSLLHRSCRE